MLAFDLNNVNCPQRTRSFALALALVLHSTQRVPHTRMLSAAPLERNAGQISHSSSPSRPNPFLDGTESASCGHDFRVDDALDTASPRPIFRVRMTFSPVDACNPPPRARLCHRIHAFADSFPSSASATFLAAFCVRRTRRRAGTLLVSVWLRHRA
ncbi:hypothetical protein B0H16DRAFT_1734653 [Mycena metata]|uniref:Uncharacterized protein n=1 Tax=Mycena metata TaxID=1033252 RepID=A0AAD7HUF6_9AGAR|nr:hypothetical protein B0H16DRAFT_1734653 [Mycena metata]